MRQNIKTIVGISLGVVLIASTAVLMVVIIPQKHELKEHVPIIIWEDEDFKNYDFEGVGSEESPYLIQYLNITTENTYGIFIRDTTVYFQIQNCYIEAGRVGIRIAEAGSGTFKLIDNTITRSYTGIEIIGSDNVLLLRNNCSYNPNCIEYTQENLAGIAILHSSNTKLIDNICVENGYYGILLTNSPFTTLINNTCNEAQISGIKAFYSANSVFINNTCNINQNYCIFISDEITNGIHIFSSENSTIINNICVGNEQSGISLWQSPNSEIANNFCQDNWVNGIDILDSNNTEVTNNICQYNEQGISLSETYTCSITDNQLVQNAVYGILLSSTSNCSLSNNELVQNTAYGIKLDTLSSNNTVHHNYFGYNNYMGISQAYDDGMGNTWYDSVALEGNWWSNWSGIDAYAIDGSANSVDPYPLDDPPF